MVAHTQKFCQSCSAFFNYPFRWLRNVFAELIHPMDRIKFPVSLETGWRLRSEHPTFDVNRLTSFVCCWWSGRPSQPRVLGARDSRPRRTESQLVAIGTCRGTSGRSRLNLVIALTHIRLTSFLDCSWTHT